MSVDGAGAWSPEAGHVAIVGSGSIGVAFAIRFTGAGWVVRLHDPIGAALDRARSELHERLALLESEGLLDEGAEEAFGRVEFVDELEQAVTGAALLQECAPEQVELKQRLFVDAVRTLPDSAVLASSTSAIAPSRIGAGLPDDVTRRLLVAHPANPPYLLPVIELVPSEVTDPGVVERARAIYAAAGMRPVLVHHEPEGFVFNRLQGALLREAYCLVRDGVASVEDIDEVVRSGLGRRWSLVGPFETADLNIRGGIGPHAERMGPAYERMGAERGQHDPWTPELVAAVVAERRAVLPLEDWAERVRWRDAQLMRLTPQWERARSDTACPLTGERDRATTGATVAP